MRYCFYYSTYLVSSFPPGRNLPGRNDLYHSCTSIEGASWRGQPLIIFTRFIGVGGISENTLKTCGLRNPRENYCQCVCHEREFVTNERVWWHVWQNFEKTWSTGSERELEPGLNKLKLYVDSETRVTWRPWQSAPLQLVAVCCSVLQRVVVCCSVL